MKNTVVPTTKKLLGTLALIGLMSVVLAKFFSDLAFADDLSFCEQDVPSELHSIAQAQLNMNPAGGTIGKVAATPTE